ncbi:MAG TPA: alpha/beta hydrolase [Amycolatopsis sp.]|jgi:pimeloyl-ACP methyl ester carboxylesterase
MVRDSIMTTYVLVHGSWCSGSVWSPVADRLTGMGHGVEVVAQLPSTGTEVAALGDLHDDVARVRTLLDGIQDDVVLVGHSYSGMIVTELAGHPSIRHSVYLAAFWPLAGQTALEARGGGPLPEWLTMREDGATELTKDATVFRAEFCADLTVAEAGKLHGALVLQSPAAFGVPATAPARTHPVTYVVIERDRSFRAPLQEHSARRADHVVHVAAAHMAQLSAPAEIAEILAATGETP